MKIAMLGVKAVPAIGGIAAYTEEVGARLAARGHEVTVYCRPKFLNGDRTPRYRGMTRRVTRGVSSKHLDAITHTLTSVLDAVRRDFDVLHFHAVGPAALVPMARVASRAATVATVHGFDWGRRKWGPGAKLCLWLADELCLRRADAVTVVARAMLPRYRGRNHAKPTFIPTGVAEPRPRPPHLIRRLGLAGGDYLLFLGRLVPEKGCHLLLSAYRSLPTRMKLVMAGDAVHDSAYAARLRAAADHRVLFPGYVTGELKEELLSNAYMLVQPSLLEGLPVTVLEAMSDGRHVLASDIPNHQEALEGFGTLFRAGDAADLRQKLDFCLRKPDLIGSQGKRAGEWIRRERSWDRTADMLEELYAELVRRKARGAAALPAGWSGGGK